MAWLRRGFYGVMAALVPAVTPPAGGTWADNTDTWAAATYTWADA